MMKVGVFVDVSNIVMNGGFGMRYDILHEFSCRGEAEAVRLNAYISYDQERAKNDPSYKDKQDRFHFLLRDLGYKVVLKETKWYTDPETGASYGKSNADLDLAVDALLQSTNLDRVVLVTGDGDFVQVVKALQNKGVRTEAVAFQNVSGDLRKEVDVYTSGYLIPGLLPIMRDGTTLKWGLDEVGHFVRGIMYHYDSQKNYGFIRYLRPTPHYPNTKLWLTDSRHPDSPYGTVFCHASELPEAFDPHSFSRNRVLEFELSPSPSKEGQFIAKNVRVIKAIT